MSLFLILVGISYVILGTLSVFTTDLIRKKFFSKFKGMDYRKWSFLPIVFGVLFLMAAPASRATLFITIIGILGLLKGFWFIMAPEKVKAYMEWWLNAKDNVYKIWGVVVIIFGAFILINV